MVLQQEVYLWALYPIEFSHTLMIKHDNNIPIFTTFFTYACDPKIDATF